MVLGLGGVGYEVLQNLSCQSGIDRLVAADVDAEGGRTRMNAARYRAEYFGRYPNLEFREVDLLDRETATATLEEVAPDVVFTAVTILPYGAFEALPEAVTEELVAFAPDGPGVACIIPGQIPLVYNLMRAVEAADVPTPHVVNASLPDVVNPVLERVDAGPVVGTGNVSHLVAPIKLLCSRRFDVPMRAVDVQLVMSQTGVHASFVNCSINDVPYHLRVRVDGTDVSDEVDLDAALQADRLPFPQQPEEAEISTITGAASARVVSALLNDTGEVIHAPGPNGLEGGFPVRLDASGAEVILPDDIDRSEAVAIGREGNRYNGVERITDDGTVVFTETTRDVFERYLGVDVASCGPDDALDVTADIVHGYQELASDHGVDPRMQVTW
jgi:hypothetical protein